MDAETTQKTLLDWAASQKLSAVTLSEDGKTLTLDATTTLAADTVLAISYDGRQCNYTAASVFLQILDPNQGLMGYRNACKKHQVKDPVKPLDKPTVVGSFLGVSTGLASEAAAPAQPPAPVSAPPAADARKKKKDHHHKKSSSRHKDSKRKASHSSPSKEHKKPREMVTNEQLFDRLNMVVDRRQVTDQRKQDLARLLSSEGFSVTPELLKEHQEKTKAIMEHEIPVGNSASILRAVNPRKDLSRVLQLFNESSASGRTKSSKQTRTTPTAKPVRRHLLGKKPIIIVPKGMTGTITLANAYDFLCKARFTPRNVVVKEGRHRNPQTTFTRSVRTGAGTTGLLEYEIMDNPRTKLGNKPNEWDRVVAVLVLGQAWQFKDWMPPSYNSPATLFDKVYGFYIGLEGDKLPTDLKGWAVQQAAVNRDKRGLDQIAFASFWNGLDEWMRVRTPELLPQAV